MCLCLVLLAGPAAAETVEEAQALYLAGEHAAALAVIEPAARAGDPLAQAVLGTAYDTGQGKPLSPQLAREWLRRAADQDYAPAAFALGMFWLEGRKEFEPDPEQAATWFGKAMALGHAEAFHMRARMMLDGLGGPGNPAAAAAFALTALELGSPDAGMLLAEMYLSGEGVPIDEERARATYARAGQLGHAPALSRLAVMHELGQGGPVDLTAAFALYQEATRLGDASAAVNLALFLTEQEGYWTDPVLGYAYCLWGNKTAPAGADYSATCATLAEGLDDDGRSMGERLAATF